MAPNQNPNSSPSPSENPVQTRTIIANFPNVKKSSLIQEILNFGITGGSVLEIGPGAGYLGLEWLKKTENSCLTGLEFSAEMIKEAENNAANYGFLGGRVKYTAYITKMLPFEDGSFEAVFSGNSLREWSEPAVILNEIQRVLKPGGRYYISDLRSDLNPLLRFYRQMLYLCYSLGSHQRSSTDKVNTAKSDSPNKIYTAKEIIQILTKTKLGGSKVTTDSSRLVITGIKPKITQINEPKPVIGISVNTCSKKAAADITQLGRKYCKEDISKTIPNKKSPPATIALSKNFHPLQKTFTYMLGDQVNSLDQIPEGFISFEIPAASYIVFTVRSKNLAGLPQAVQEMKNYIYQYWFPNSNYQKAPFIEEFELYDERSQSSKNPEMDIYVPVR